MKKSTIGRVSIQLRPCLLQLPIINRPGTSINRPGTSTARGQRVRFAAFRCDEYGEPYGIDHGGHVSVMPSRHPPSVGLVYTVWLSMQMRARGDPASSNVLTGFGMIVGSKPDAGAARLCLS